MNFFFFLQFLLKRKCENFAQGWWWKVPVQAQHDFEDTYRHTMTRRKTALGYHSGWTLTAQSTFWVFTWHSVTGCFWSIHVTVCVTDLRQGHAKCKHILKHSNQRYRSDCWNTSFVLSRRIVKRWQTCSGQWVYFDILYFTTLEPFFHYLKKRLHCVYAMVLHKTSRVGHSAWSGYYCWWAVCLWGRRMAEEGALWKSEKKNASISG